MYQDLELHHNFCHALSYQNNHQNINCHWKKIKSFNLFNISDCYGCSDEGTHTQNINYSSTRSHAPEEENRVKNRSENCESVNGH